jgi:glycosidase
MPWDTATGFTSGSPWFPYAPGRERENVAAQTNDPESLLSRYRKLIAARHASSALMKGTIDVLDTSGQVLAFVRTDEKERVLVVHNLSDGFTNSGPLAVSGAGLEKIFADPFVPDPSGASGSWSVILPPRTSGVWRVR